MKSGKKNTRWAVWAGALAAALILSVPALLVAGFFTNVEGGPGNDFLFWLGYFLMLPLFVLKGTGIILSESFGWVIMVFLETLWLFGLMLAGYGIIYLEKRYITVPSSRRAKQRRAA